LNLSSEKPVSKFAFKLFNLYRCNEGVVSLCAWERKLMEKKLCTWLGLNTS
jgi:hypothetical protein